MKPLISKLYQIRTGGELSPHECQAINTELSMLTARDIPLDQRANVTDYLISALNYNSVHSHITPKLEALLLELQEHA